MCHQDLEQAGPDMGLGAEFSEPDLYQEIGPLIKVLPD